MGRLKGKIVIITRGAQGMGAAHARRFVVVTGTELVIDGGLTAL